MYRAALYMRLSRDDEGAGESASIAAQRKLLRRYARENGFAVAEEYIDDGWSGTNFDRPDFKRMMADVEDKRINLIMTKDFSRLGRDYIATGQYTEVYFPEHGVRYIAVNDGYDSMNPSNDIAPFKHVINEMYARDASKKIRSALQTKMREGSYIGNFAPYGFKKDPANKNHLVIDGEAAPVVREIFQRAGDGERPWEIAEYLNLAGIASPIVYRCATRPHLNLDDYTSRGAWTSSTICKMLANLAYLGHTAQGKSSKPSFKSKTAIRKPRGEWYLVEHTHEAIISQDLFDLVRKRCVSRRAAPKSGFQNAFSGIAKCADCGGNMSTTGTRKKGSAYNLVCGRYKLYGSGACSNHFIDYRLLHDAVWSEVREMLSLSEGEKQQALERARRDERPSGGKDEAALRAKALEGRDKELDHLLRRLYEDHVKGKIGEQRFAKLSAVYEAEQREVCGKREMLAQSARGEDTPDSHRRFYQILSDLPEIGELTPGLVKRLIDRMEIGQGRYEQTPQGKKKRQTVRIFWRFAAG